MPVVDCRLELKAADAVGAGLFKEVIVTVPMAATAAATASPPSQRLRRPPRGVSAGRAVLRLGAVPSDVMCVSGKGWGASGGCRWGGAYWRGSAGGAARGVSD